MLAPGFSLPEWPKADGPWRCQMFTVIAFVGVGLIAGYTMRVNAKERYRYDDNRTAIDERMFLLLLHVRQDMQLIVYLLAGAIVMLGIIADRIG
jgi:hypothetical protein